MCKMVYIGSDHPLPMTAPWDEKNPKFHVTPVEKSDEEAVRKCLRTNYVIYAGSTMGCGCNFEYDSKETTQWWFESKPDQMKEYLEDQTQDKLLRDELLDLWLSTVDQASKMKHLKCWLQDKQSVDDLRAYLDRNSKTGSLRVLVTWAEEESTAPQWVLSVTPEFFGGESFYIEEFTLLEVSQRVEQRDRAWAHHYRGLSRIKRGYYDEAISAFTEAVASDPELLDAYVNRGVVYEQKSQYGQAILDYNKALEINPQDAEVYNNLAWLLGTAKAPHFRDGRKALELSLKACELSEWKGPNYLDTLAAAYARIGDFANAVKFAQKVMESPEFVEDKEAQKRLNLYNDQKPWPPD